MPYITFDIETQDELTLFGQAWIPRTKTRAVIYLVHGIGDHSTRFVHVANAMESAGFAFITFDLRGHGKSDGKRGHAHSFDDLMNDLSRVIERHSSMFDSIPRFLYGHSFGGNLALNYILQKDPNFAGAIITSPWLKLAFEPPAHKIKLGEFVDGIYPSLLQKTNLDTAALSRDTNVVFEYTHDPLVHDKISARMFLQTRKYGLYALENAARFPIPLLLMHGTADRITSFAASEEFAGKCTTKSEFKKWDGFFHELHNEPEKEEVIAFTIDWINRILQTNAKM